MCSSRTSITRYARSKPSHHASHIPAGAMYVKNSNAIIDGITSYHYNEGYDKGGTKPGGRGVILERRLSGVLAR